MQDLKVEPVFRELSSLSDLGRLACAFERVPKPIFGIEDDDGSFVLSVHTEQLGDSPVFFFARSKKIDHFLRYRLEGESEEVNFSDDASDARNLYSPILHIRKVPDSFKKALNNNLAASSLASQMELSDVIGLLKLSPYRMLLDESPAPLYLSTADNQSYLGIFVHIGDSEGSDLYFFVKISSDPQKNFVKYNPQKPNEWAFTNRTDDHGKYFAKLIRLKQGPA
ncbi:MAG: hypothetical protein QXV84_02745 [Conexivisphaerales archaeon]